MSSSSIALKKKKFEIEIIMVEPDGIGVYATFDGGYFTRTLSTVDVKKVFPELNVSNYVGAPAEYLFNKNDDITVFTYQGVLDINYWYYDSKDDHRFNYVEIDPGSIKGTRRIKFLNIYDGNPIPVEQVDQPLYLIFLYQILERTQPNSDGEYVIKSAVEIKWLDDESVPALSSGKDPISLLTSPKQEGLFAVLEFEGNNIASGEVRALTNRLRSELVGKGQLTIIERGKMEEILKEQAFQQTGCVSSECAVEVGKLLGVQNIITGSISKVGNIYSVEARAVSVESGEIIKTAVYDHSGDIGGLLTQGMRKVAEELGK
jgi:TolB-like protein